MVQLTSMLDNYGLQGAGEAYDGRRVHRPKVIAEANVFDSEVSDAETVHALSIDTRTTWNPGSLS